MDEIPTGSDSMAEKKTPPWESLSQRKRFPIPISYIENTTVGVHFATFEMKSPKWIIHFRFGLEDFFIFKW